jgi:chaperonin GroEL (HSP60 family)
VRRAYLYAGDLFKPLDLSWGELVELAERPEAVLERFRREIEELAGPVRSLKLRKAVVAGSGEAVVEYVAELAGGMASGEASVKIVYAEDPARALREFYEREKRGSA